MPSVPYFHISSARPGGTAAADNGFASRCLRFALEEAKRDMSGQGLIEFPKAWSRKFRQVQDPGKTYWISFKKRRLEDFGSTQEKMNPHLSSPGKNKLSP